MKEKIKRLNEAIKEFFATHPDVAIAKPKDIMPYFRQESGEPYADYREGLPIRDILRKLEKENKLIIGCYFDQKDTNKSWHFQRQN